MKTANDPVFPEIIRNNAAREEAILSEHACRSSEGCRAHPEREQIPDEQNFRPVFYHDTDTIIHSRIYTRYIDKTQVFSLFENDHITHRVLHVQFVAKIARVIGRSLRLNEDLIEAIALGHDLGHAPFGHDGEYILNDLCAQHQIGSFCHNAQSVRSMLEIENQGQGLNLSLQVLDGILAHNGEMIQSEYRPQYGKTWPQLIEEYQACFKDAKFSKTIRSATLEGCVVRISDVIAYIGRDIEDAIEIKLLQRNDIPRYVVETLGHRNAQIIDTLVTDLIANSFEQDHLRFSEDVFRALQQLLAFNREKIYFNPRIKSELPKVKNIFCMMFDRLLQDLKQGRHESAIFRYFLRDGMKHYQETTPPERIVIDFLAGMTDRFLIDQFEAAFLPRSFGYHAYPA
jgi:dGTPase